MKRTWTIWLAFALCAAVVLAAMAWISRTTLELERAERQANRRAAAEEKVRLAVSQMDAALMPLIVQESARPYFVYEPFHAVGLAYTRLYQQLGTNEVFVPSPLLGLESDDVLVHFQVDAAGELTSPQVPTGNLLDLATDGYTTGEKVEAARALLEKLAGIVERRKLLARLPDPGPPAPATRPAGKIQRPRTDLPLAAEQAAADELSKLQAQRKTRPLSRDEITQLLNSTNMMARFRATSAAQFAQQVAFNHAVAPRTVAEGPLRPCWVGDALLLARRVRLGDAEVLQGCWLNWEHIRTRLLGEARELLPATRLLPAGDEGPRSGRCVLTALPVRLVPGDVPEDLSAARSPVRLSLLIAWACVLLGAGAVAVLLGKTLGLSRRRGAFVSAVTHELRTPLTTFRLYADMLAGGMVADEAKRAGYLRRLRDEADRLSHLVENVLAYAGLGGSRSAAHLETVRVGEVVERSRERLAALAERADMHLAVEADDEVLDERIRCNTSAVEQILLNLVDNACKYAGRSEDRRIHLRAACRNGAGVLTVRDHGPGVPRAERKRLFHAFRKSAREAAHSAPGIGLGLALSRRLARRMGGELRFEPTGDDGGASFTLTLPLDEPS